MCFYCDLCVFLLCLPALALSFAAGPEPPDLLYFPHLKPASFCLYIFISFPKLFLVEVMVKSPSVENTQPKLI